MIKDSKKITVLCVIIFSAILLFALSIYLLLPKEKPSLIEKEYYPVNYDENIFLNRAYMGFQRDLLYSVGGVEQLFSYEKDYDTAEAECKFFLKYFRDVICGDYESYKNLFVDGYFDEDPKFTMQMIYDPYVQYHSASTEELDGKEINIINFQVSYRIFKNNKSFRSDVDSNEAIPQIFQLIKTEDGSYKIYRILSIEVEDGN